MAGKSLYKRAVDPWSDDVKFSPRAKENKMFEDIEREKVGKKGVVRDPQTHQEVLDAFVALADQLEFTILGLTFSPVKGPEGNIEFLGHLTLEKKPGIVVDTAKVVADAHETLKG